MKLLIKGKTMYKNGLVFCRVEAGNGRVSLPHGTYGVEVLTATEHGTIPMPFADGLGWIGGLGGCDVVVGRVVGRNGLVPNLDTQDHLVSLCELVTDAGERVTLEIQE